MSMPKLVELNKTEIVRLNLNLAKPEDVPIEKILSYMTRLSYQKEKFELSPPDYPFEIPIGASNYNASVKDAFKLLSRDPTLITAMRHRFLSQDKCMKTGQELKKFGKSFSVVYEIGRTKLLIAEYKVGLYYLQGKVAHQNYQLAMDWLTKALRGSAQAQFVLGTIYEHGVDENGRVIFNNFDKAKAMYSLAIDGGLSLAVYHLAQLYSRGLLNYNDNVPL